MVNAFALTTRGEYREWHEAVVTHVVMSADGSILTSGAENGTVCAVEDGTDPVEQGGVRGVELWVQATDGSALPFSSSAGYRPCPARRARSGVCMDPRSQVELVPNNLSKLIELFQESPTA